MTEARASIGPYTWDDFVALEEDDLRELIEGELVEVEVPTKMHECIVWMLSHDLAVWALPRNAGFGVVSGFKVKVSEQRGVMPDLTMGVPEYWIVDPGARTLECLVLQGNKCLVTDVLAGDAVFRPDAFPEMEIPLGGLWRLPEGD